MKRYFIFPLLMFLRLGGSLLHAQQISSEKQGDVDYRARTIYFLLADRFNPHQPYGPYVDPEHPFATNTRNCFEEPCTRNDEFRRYWGGDIQGIIQRLDYLDHLGASAFGFRL